MCSSDLAANWERFGTLVGDLTDEMIDGIEEISEQPEYSENSEFSECTYDLMGRKVTDLKPGNIYIRNGKKFMVR